MPILRVDAHTCQPADLAAAVDWLRAGRVVVFPTDTFYGLAGDPRSDAAVAEIFRVKGRAEQAALPLVAASTDQVRACCGPLPALAERLAARFWPGALALVIEAPPDFSAAVHGGTRSIAIRVPAHPVARALAAAFGAPVTATSANRSGEPPAASIAALGTVADEPRLFVIDAGATPGGAASTIVDVRGRVPVLVRAGATPWNRVLESIEE